MLPSHVRRHMTLTYSDPLSHNHKHHQHTHTHIDRIGQEKQMHVLKYVCDNTIEEKINWQQQQQRGASRGDNQSSSQGNDKGNNQGEKQGEKQGESGGESGLGLTQGENHNNIGFATKEGGSSSSSSSFIAPSMAPPRSPLKSPTKKRGKSDMACVDFDSLSSILDLTREDSHN